VGKQEGSEDDLSPQRMFTRGGRLKLRASVDTADEWESIKVGILQHYRSKQMNGMV
jgi:hypothetical protein